MKNILQEYIPFEHDNTDYINTLINFARQQQKGKEPENILASSVIYANLVEYLAAHLLKNIQHMIYLASYFQLQGVFFLKSEEKKYSTKPLGPLTSELGKYEFPDKIEFLKLLNNFNTSRNNLMHRLMNKKTMREINNLDRDLLVIQNNAEEILQKYNVIISGIQTIWNRITKVEPTTEQVPKPSEREA